MASFCLAASSRALNLSPYNKIARMIKLMAAFQRRPLSVASHRGLRTAFVLQF